VEGQQRPSLERQGDNATQNTCMLASGSQLLYRAPGRPIPNQPGRRSLVPCQGPELALTLKPLQAAKGGAANVSHDTIRKAEVVQERGDPRLIVQARRGADDIHDFVS